MRRTSWAVIFFASVILVLPLSQSLYWKHVIPGTGIVLSDLLDLVVTAPLLYLGLGGLLVSQRHESDSREAHPRWGTLARLLLYVSVPLLIEGHGIHFAANSIHNAIDRTSGTPLEVHQLAYFYDEILSHRLVFTGMLSMLLSASLWDVYRPNRARASRLDALAIVAGGAVAGIAMALALLEGQAPFLGFVMLPLMAVVGQVGRTCRAPLARHPLWLFGSIAALVSVVTMVFWAIHYGGFIEPSAR